MKKLLGLGLALALFASCSDDDSSSSVNMDNLSGKWYPVSTKAGDETFEYEHESCAKDYLEFAASGVFKTYEVWGCTGSQVSDSDESTGTYSVSGNKVTIAIDGGTETVTVKKLTSSTLHVTYREDMDEDGEADITVTEIYSRN